MNYGKGGADEVLYCLGYLWPVLSQLGGRDENRVDAPPQATHNYVRRNPFQRVTLRDQCSTCR